MYQQTSIPARKKKKNKKEKLDLFETQIDVCHYMAKSINPSVLNLRIITDKKAPNKWKTIATADRQQYSSWVK